MFERQKVKPICTCHLDDNPPKPCAEMYELSQCREREAFEQWASDGGKFTKAVERVGNGYRIMQIDMYWKAWQARALYGKEGRYWEPKG